MEMPMVSLRRLLVVLSLPLLLLTACGTQNNGTTASTKGATVSLNVFAAASLTESFSDIKKAYQTSHPNITITYNFAGSQTLKQQIANGAPCDVFAAADQTNMQKAASANLVGPDHIFARNKLVVIVPTSNPAHINSLHDLAKSGVKIDIGAPSVPVGKYTSQMLDNLGKTAGYGESYVSSVKKNVVSQENNVKAIVQKVSLGIVDAGIVYATDLTPTLIKQVTTIDIPESANIVAKYPIAVAKKSAHPSEAEAFVQSILSSDGQAILAKYHFLSPS
jgi:molybdate transport system substrate-binding protein